MRTFTFTKTKGAWYINDFHASNKQQLEPTSSVLEGSEAILNLLAGNGTTVTVNLDTEPFEDAAVLELMQLCQPFLDGGYYYLHLYAGKAIDFKIWMCDVPKYAFGSMPERIYLRKA